MIPASKPKRTGRPYKYPWRTMEVGDSFFATRKSSCMRRDADRCHPDRKFRLKTVMKDGQIGCRVWRIG